MQIKDSASILHNDGPMVLISGGTNRRVLIIFDIRLEALPARNGDLARCPTGISKELVAFEGGCALLRKSWINEIDKRIAQIQISALVDWQVEEIESVSAEAQRLQLHDELLLRVTMRDVPQHQGRHQTFCVNVFVGRTRKKILLVSALMLQILQFRVDLNDHGAMCIKASLEKFFSCLKQSSTLS